MREGSKYVYRPRAKQQGGWPWSQGQTLLACTAAAMLVSSIHHTMSVRTASLYGTEPSSSKRKVACRSVPAGPARAIRMALQVRVWNGNVYVYMYMCISQSHTHNKPLPLYHHTCSYTYSSCPLARWGAFQSWCCGHSCAQ